MPMDPGTKNALTFARTVAAVNVLLNVANNTHCWPSIFMVSCANLIL